MYLKTIGNKAGVGVLAMRRLQVSVMALVIQQCQGKSRMRQEGPLIGQARPWLPIMPIDMLMTGQSRIQLISQRIEALGAGRMAAIRDFSMVRFSGFLPIKWDLKAKALTPQ